MIAKVVVPVGDVEDLGTEAAAMDEAKYVRESELSTSNWKSGSSQALKLLNLVTVKERNALTIFLVSKYSSCTSCCAHSYT